MYSTTAAPTQRLVLSQRPLAFAPDDSGVATKLAVNALGSSGRLETLMFPSADTVAFLAPQRLFSSTRNGEARISFHWDDGAESFVGWNVRDGATAAAVSPDGALLAVADARNELVLEWVARLPDEPTSTVLSVKLAAGPVRALAFSPDGRELLIMLDHATYRWDVPHALPGDGPEIAGAIEAQAPWLFSRDTWVPARVPPHAAGR